MSPAQPGVLARIRALAVAPTGRDAEDVLVEIAALAASVLDRPPLAVAPGTPVTGTRWIHVKTGLGPYDVIAHGRLKVSATPIPAGITAYDGEPLVLYGDRAAGTVFARFVSDFLLSFHEALE